MKDLEKTLQTYFLDKAPKMPADLQKLLVQYGPYVVLIGVVMSAMSLLTSLGVMSFVNPMRMFMGAYVGMMYQLYMVFTVLTTVLSALAIPGLLKKSMKGWQYMLYTVMVNTVLSIVTFNIAGLLIGSGLGFYILYQIRHHYK